MRIAFDTEAGDETNHQFVAFAERVALAVAHGGDDSGHGGFDLIRKQYDASGGATREANIKAKCVGKSLPLKWPNFALKSPSLALQRPSLAFSRQWHKYSPIREQL